MFLIIRNDDKQKQFKMYDYWNKQQQTIKHFAGIKLKKTTLKSYLVVIETKTYELQISTYLF